MIRAEEYDPDKISNFPFVSIVICTLNRKEMLSNCLDSIFALNYPRSHFEVIIVDGGSTDGTPDLTGKFPDTKFIVEKRGGIALARNIGAEHAKGSVVTYTDDDCIVNKNWLKNLVEGFTVKDSRIIGVGGPVCPISPEIIPKKLLVNAALGLFDEGKDIKLVAGIVTSNCAFKREAFKIAKFDESIGATRRRNLLLGGEDTVFCDALGKAGYQFLYMPQAKVYHVIPMNRLRVLYIIKRALHMGISEQKALIKWRRSRISSLRYIVGRIGQFYFAFLRNRSLTTCYDLISAIATLIVCITFLDRLLFD